MYDDDDGGTREVVTKTRILFYNVGIYIYIYGYKKMLNFKKI